MIDNSAQQGSRSAIYKGHLRHRRFYPVSHEFDYQIAMLMIDLDFVEQEFGRFPLSCSSMPAPGWFKRSDYAGGSDSDLKSYIADNVSKKTGLVVDGKITLLTHLRYWGFVMNPVSVFYCYDKAGQLLAVVLQVTNTPWREKQLYIVPIHWRGRNHVSTFDKQMHVSPFNPMNMQYLLRLQAPGKTLFFHLENHQTEQCHTDATMVFDRYPMTYSGLLWLCLRQPAMTAKVGLAIYWQALRLWCKKVPLHDHPETITAKHATEGSRSSSASTSLSD